MNPFTAIKTCYIKLFTFTGRASRSEFWWWQLYSNIIFVSIQLSILEVLIQFTINTNINTILLVGLFGASVIFFLLIPSLAVMVRRLHDINHSGEWAWLVIIPYIGYPALCIWLLKKGDKDANQYGTAPHKKKKLNEKKYKLQGNLFKGIKAISKCIINIIKDIILIIVSSFVLILVFNPLIIIVKGFFALCLAILSFSPMQFIIIIFAVSINLIRETLLLFLFLPREILNDAIIVNINVAIRDIQSTEKDNYNDDKKDNISEDDKKYVLQTTLISCLIFACLALGFYLIPHRFPASPASNQKNSITTDNLKDDIGEVYDAEAQNILGVMYYNGDGITQDYKEAVKWFRKSAEQGNAQAQYNLGIMYYHGKGVTQNYKESAKYYRKSAEQGNAKAQYWLGLMYANGDGVAQNYVNAYTLALMAKANGKDDVSVLIKHLSKDITTAQIKQAQALASKCLESDYKNCDGLFTE